jgi:hypothetical protein
MAERRPSLDEVLQRLAQRDQLTAADRDRAATWAKAVALEVRTPWYVQPLIFLGALLAAVMITVGIASTLDLRWTGAPLLTLGSIYLAAALVLHRCRDNDFTAHLALVFSIGAHALLLAGVDDFAGDHHPGMTVLLTAATLSAALYGVYRDFLHRFLSCLLVCVVAKFAFPAAGLHGALHGLVAALVVVCAVVLLRERQLPLWRPLAYACGCGLPLILLPLSERGLWFEDPELPHRWIASIVLGLATLGALRSAAVHLAVRTSAAAQALAALFVAGLGTLSAPGILAAMFLIVLGYAAQHWQLVLIGLLALPAFVFKYYYNLELDFMTKSGVLAGSGVLLLLARQAFARGLAAQAGTA